MAKNRISVLVDVTVDRANRALSSFRKSVSEADGAVGKFRAGAKSAGDSLRANIAPVAATAGIALLGFATQAVRAASRLEESTNAVNKTFGDAAEGVLEIGENAAESMGLSRSAFNEAAVSFSSFAKNIAGPGGDVAAVIEQLTRRAADFGSVMNIDVAEAATVFRSGLSGETEPLKRFGIDLSAAAVEAHALAKGMVSSKSEMTEAIKVQARYSLLMERTNEVAGDFADTSEGLANTTRIASARLEDFKARVGAELIPVVASAANAAMDLADSLERVGFEAVDADARLGDGGFMGTLKEVLNPTELAIRAWNTAGDAAKYLTGETDEATRRAAAFEGRMRTMQARSREATTAVEDLADANRDASNSFDAVTTAAGAAGQEIIDSRAAARRLEEQLRALPQQTIVTVRASTREANAALDSLIGKLQNIGSRATTMSVVAANRFRQRATGGVVGHGETTLVGERGPELAEFPPGTRIHTAQQTASMLSGGGTAPNVYMTVHVAPGAGQIDFERAVVEAFKKFTRRNGPGSVGL